MSEDPVALLPHRPPFRFVDSVDELVPGERITARYRVTGDEAFLAGHFPGNPIFPGVIQLEALAQAGAIALLALERYAGSLPLFGGVEGVRWRRQVVPGEEGLVASHPVAGPHPLARHQLVDGVDEPERRPVGEEGDRVAGHAHWCTLRDARSERSALRAEYRTVLMIRSLRSLTGAPFGMHAVSSRHFVPSTALCS